MSDPVGSGFVSSLARPGGNITGFLNIEASVVGKWLTLMREIAPKVSRIGFLYNPQTAPFAPYYLDTFRAASPTLAIEAIDAPVHSTEEVEAFMTKLGDEAGAGLFVMSDTSMVVYRKTIYSAAERCRLPTIYPYRVFAAEGGLMSYGVDVTDLLRARPPTSTAYFAVKNRTNLQSSSRPDLNWSSTQKRRRCSALQFQHRWSLLPKR